MSTPSSYYIEVSLQSSSSAPFNRKRASDRQSRNFRPSFLILNVSISIKLIGCKSWNSSYFAKSMLCTSSFYFSRCWFSNYMISKKVNLLSFASLNRLEDKLELNLSLLSASETDTVSSPSRLMSIRKLHYGFLLRSRFKFYDAR